MLLYGVGFNFTTAAFGTENSGQPSSVSPGSQFAVSNAPREQDIASHHLFPSQRLWGKFQHRLQTPRPQAPGPPLYAASHPAQPSGRRRPPRAMVREPEFGELASIAPYKKSKTKKMDSRAAITQANAPITSQKQCRPAAPAA